MKNSNKDSFIKIKNKIFTKNLFPSIKVYDEKFKYFNKVEYRQWNPFKSKLGAAIIKSKNIDLNLLKNKNILYLGASCGTTVSHISDINIKKIFAVELSYEMGIYLVALSRFRKNIFPIIENARNINILKKLIGNQKIDLIIQDIPGKFQSDLIIEMSLAFLKKNAIIYFSIKLSSINSKDSLKVILDNQLKKLKTLFIIEDIIFIKPYEKNHYFLIMKKK